MQRISWRVKYPLSYHQPRSVYLTISTSTLKLHHEWMYFLWENKPRIHAAWKQERLWSVASVETKVQEKFLAAASAKTPLTPLESILVLAEFTDNFRAIDAEVRQSLKTSTPARHHRKKLKKLCKEASSWVR